MKKFFVASVLCLLSFGGANSNAAENRRVKIVNRASAPIRYFYASNVDRGNWEEDILGPGRVLFTDHYIWVNIDDGSGHCRYDLRAVLADGRQAVRRNFNVCAESSWTVVD